MILGLRGCSPGMGSVGPSVGSKSVWSREFFFLNVGFPVVFAKPPLAFAVISRQPLGVGRSLSPLGWRYVAVACIKTDRNFSHPGPPSPRAHFCGMEGPLT